MEKVDIKLSEPAMSSIALNTIYSILFLKIIFPVSIYRILYTQSIDIEYFSIFLMDK